VVTLRGKSWDIVDVAWCRAEPDVGIMSDYVDGYDLEDADGNRWDWDRDQLTAEEEQVIDKALGDLRHEPNDDGE
jgi:hypothetical protein